MVQLWYTVRVFEQERYKKNAVGISSLKIGHRFVRYPIYLGGG